MSKRALLLLIVLGSFSWDALSMYAADPIQIQTQTILNQNANQVGLWINTIAAVDTPKFDREKLTAALKPLNLKSIRYGWQYGILDPKNTNSQRHSPRDKDAQGFFTNAQHYFREQMGPDGIASMIQDLNCKGFVVLSTDGIRYRGTEDQTISKMSPSDRLRFYSDRAAEFAKWGRDNGITHFEIGNENDMTGGEKDSVFLRWTPEMYAKVVREYLTAIKQVFPDARCGINGGLLDDGLSEQWFQRIFKADPGLAADLDFVVMHKYEMWLDEAAWESHPDWQFGRAGQGMRDCHAKYFPDLSIQVTEIGPWKLGENGRHLRALLATEMLGNVYFDPMIENVQYWPSWWGTEGGLIAPVEPYSLTPEGLGVRAYTQFARPQFIANGVAGSIRYFAAKDPSGALTVWLVNHSASKMEQPIHIPMTTKERSARSSSLWSLYSISDDLRASDSVLENIGAFLPEVDDVESGVAVYRVPVRPYSVTILTID